VRARTRKDLLSAQHAVLLMSTRQGTTLDPVEDGEGKVGEVGEMELGTRTAKFWGHSFTLGITKQLKTKLSALPSCRNSSAFSYKA
jgi:hypothetical protein